jgi:diaminopimelate epimerase
MQFTKMHGCGNDFVVIDAINQALPEDMAAFCQFLGDRHFGVGCDQILIVAASECADFQMLIFNCDGSKVEMCGNGIRCMARYVVDKGLTDKTKLDIETLAGIIKPEIVGDLVRVDMGEPGLNTPDWVWDDEQVVAKPYEAGGKQLDITLVSMGNPHCVSFHDELTDDLVLGIGPKIENDRGHFPNRINVEFIHRISATELDMRVWERGAGETLACGTGASASCVAAILNGLTERKVTIHLTGGDLELEWNQADNHVYMTGPAATVFEGTLPE